MRWIYNFKISAKLLIGFILVAMIAAVIGVVGIVNIKNITKEDTELFQENTRGLKYAGDANGQFLSVRVNSLRMLVLKDEKARSEHINKIKEHISNADEQLNKYEEKIANEEDQALYNELKPLWKEYKTMIEKAIELVQSGDLQGAEKLIMEDSSSNIEALNNVFARVFEYNAASAKEKADNNTKVASIAMGEMVIAMFIGVVIAIGLGVLLSQIISRPIKKLEEVAEQIALGDVDVKVEATSKDEIGNLMRAFSKMVDNIREQAHIVERLAEGDMTVQVKVKSENDLMGKKLIELININNRVLGNINSAADEVASGARQVADSSLILSQGSTEQASSIEEITASIEQIAEQTKKNAFNAAQANEIALKAKENAEAGNSQMQEMIKAMEEINYSSNNISKIIKVIDDIAFQTNILALNAAVEAARAGQHGKGFAVVADEVRNLAARSASAAKETTELIENSIKKVEMGNKIASDTADALNQIVEGVTKAADLVGEIAEASNEQALGIEQINAAIYQVSHVVQSNSATAEESAAASEELSAQAELLKESVSSFKLKKVEENFDMEVLDAETIRAIEEIVERKKMSQNIGQTADFNTEKVVEAESDFKDIISLKDDNFGKY